MCVFKGIESDAVAAAFGALPECGTPGVIVAGSAEWLAVHTCNATHAISRAALAAGGRARAVWISPCAPRAVRLAVGAASLVVAATCEVSGETQVAAVSRRAVRDLYEHVRDESRRRGNGDYLPLTNENSAKYNQMRYVWKLHRRGELQAAS